MLRLLTLNIAAVLIATAVTYSAIAFAGLSGDYMIAVPILGAALLGVQLIFMILRGKKDDAET